MKGRVTSFKYAGEGILTALKDQPNLLIHLGIGFLVFMAAIYFQVSKSDWLILILCMGLVIGLELTNTAIEELVNSFTEVSHPSAKKAKDVAAGAVLIAAITSAVIGVIIFLPYLHLPLI